MASAVDPFKISAVVPGIEATYAEYRAASNATRARFRSQLDVPCGKAPRQKLDLFFPPGEIANAPVHMFIHGGYWRAQVKEDYAFVADGIIAAGAIAAILEYTLMPGARMAQLVGEVRDAMAFLKRSAATFGGDGSKLSASGHSAGAHLCTYLASRSPHESHLPATPVKSLLMLSGIYDLRPITTSFLRDEVRLTDEEVAHWSPFEAVQSTGTHFEVAVGHNETEPFHTQAHDYAYAAKARGADVERITLPGLDHMQIVRQLGVVGSRMQQLLAQAVERSAS